MRIEAKEEEEEETSTEERGAGGREGGREIENSSRFPFSFPLHPWAASLLVRRLVQPLKALL